MATSEDRQAKALEGILGQLTFIVMLLRKQSEPKIPPLEEIDLEYNKIARLPNELDAHVRRSVEDAKAKLGNRPKVMEVLERWRTIDAPMNIEVINVHACDGEVVFYGHINGQPLPGWQIQGVIKDVY
jgi:hypothetical protein